jgi:hypothetical protein
VAGAVYTVFWPTRLTSACAVVAKAALAANKNSARRGLLLIFVDLPNKSLVSQGGHLLLILAEFYRLGAAAATGVTAASGK